MTKIEAKETALTVLRTAGNGRDALRAARALLLLDADASAPLTTEERAEVDWRIEHTNPSSSEESALLALAVAAA